jgi:hypothetical protein
MLNEKKEGKKKEFERRLFDDRNHLEKIRQEVILK